MNQEKRVNQLKKQKMLTVCQVFDNQSVDWQYPGKTFESVRISSQGE